MAILRRVTESKRSGEEMWAESERLYFERESRRLRWAWVRFYEDQAERAERTGALLAARDRAKAQKLIDELVEEERENGHRKGDAA